MVSKDVHTALRGGGKQALPVVLSKLIADNPYILRGMSAALTKRNAEGAFFGIDSNRFAKTCFSKFRSLFFANGICFYQRCLKDE
jgi:hypothetical protein